MTNKIYFLILVLVFITSQVFYATEILEFKKSYQFLQENINEEELENILIKGHRVQLWETFSKSIYNSLSEGGNIKGGELFPNPVYTVLLLSLNENYLYNGDILYIKKNPLLGISKSKWVSVRDMEEEVFPDLENRLIIIEDEGKREQFLEIADKLVWRINTLSGVRFTSLWLIPPEGDDNEWRSIESCEDEEIYDIYNILEDAFKRQDSREFVENWDLLYNKINDYQKVERIWRFTVERVYNKLPLMTLVFFLYLASSVLLFFYIPLKREFLNKISFLFIILGFILHLAFLILRSLIGWHLPVTGMYEFISLLSWASVLIYIVIYIRYKMPFIGAIVIPLSLILIVISSLFPREIETQLIPALKSYWLTIHVTLASLSEGAFAIGFASALFFLFKGKKKGGLLPSRERLEEIAYKSILIGYPLFTIGALVAGAIWAEQAWGNWWSWDPKETCSLIVWLFATAYLHARITRGWRGKRSAILVIIIFGLSLFTLFSNLIFGGLHSYGTG